LTAVAVLMHVRISGQPHAARTTGKWTKLNISQ